MMNLYQRNNGGRRKLWAATVLVILLFLADLVSGGKVRALVRSGGVAISGSLGAVVNTIGGSGFFSSRAGLVAQNRTLSEQLSQYEERAAAFAALQAENEQLRSLTHLSESIPGITAPVVSSVISSPYGTFLIGAGSEDGVSAGSLVLTPGGFVVGKVSNAGPHISTVSQVFAPMASLDAVVRGSPVTLSGSGGGNAHALVPRSMEVETGDTVLSPEFGQRPVGIVGAVASSSARATQDVYIRLPVGLSALQFVYVVSL